MSERRLKYPPEFSRDARNAVETEALKADRDLRQYRDTSRIRPDRTHSIMQGGVRRWTDDEEDIIEYILRVGLAFGLQACELGLGSQGWPLDRIRQVANEFLRQLTIDAYYNHVLDLRRPGFIGTLGNVEPKVTRELEKSVEWHRFEDALLAIGKRPLAHPPQQNDPHPLPGETPRSASEPGDKNPLVAEGATEDFLGTLFGQFDQEEQAKIRAAEKSTSEILARGAADANGRQRAAGPHDVPDWVQQPHGDARADAAGVVFVAYANALWRKTDAAGGGGIRDFLADIDKLIAPVLAKYGWEGKGLVDELRWNCEANASLVHSQTPTGATRPPILLEFLDSMRERKRERADLKAACARRLGRDDPESGRQEDLLKDSREWARAALKEIVPEIHDFLDLKQRVVKQTWDLFVPTHRYCSDFKLGYLEFTLALWEEGWPSLEDRAIEAILESERSHTDHPAVSNPTPSDSARSGNTRSGQLSVLGGPGQKMADSQDAVFDVHLSDQWRIHCGPVKKSDRAELRDRIIPLIINTFGSVDSSLDLLLKESPCSTGRRVTTLIRAYELFCLQRSREGAEVHDHDRQQHFAKVATEFGELGGFENGKILTAGPDDDKIRAVLRTNFCRLPIGLDTTVQLPGAAVASHRKAAPQLSLEAVAKDEERREKAKNDLVRALQSYINKLDDPDVFLHRDATRVTGIFCDYARENYASRAEKVLTGLPAIDPRVLFEAANLRERGDLCGLPTISDVFRLVETVSIEKLKLKNGSLNWLLLEEPWGNWFASQIRDCVNESVRAKREEYEQRFPSSPLAGSPARLAAIPSGNRGGGGMDLSDLPENALRLIAEAEVEAKYILRESDVSDLFSTKVPTLEGEQSDPEPEESSGVRNRAARHLFGVTAKHVWERVQPDLVVFKARLNQARNWVGAKFHPGAGVLNAATVYELKCARRELKSKPPVSAQPKILPRGLLSTSMMRRKQALKEGRLEGYVKRPSDTQVSPRLTSGRLSEIGHPTVLAKDSIGPGEAGLSKIPSDSPSPAMPITIAQLTKVLGQPLTPEWSKVLDAGSLAVGEAEDSYKLKLNKILRMAGRMEISVEDFKSQLPALLQELGLEIPAGVLKLSRGSTGRPSAATTKGIHAEWVKMGSPQVTAQVCDKIGRIVFAKETQAIKPGTKKHKRVRERVRQVLRRTPVRAQHN